MPGKNLWLKGSSSGNMFVVPLIGDFSGPEILSAVKMFQAYFHKRGDPFLIKGATLNTANFFSQTWPGYFSFSPDLNSYDYVYRSSDLINLPGPKYRTKRNHLNHFKRQYPDFRFEPLTPAAARKCGDCIRAWADGKGSGKSAMTADEHQAIGEALNHREALGLISGAILVNDRIEAFSLGEELNEDTFVIHIEKANPGIRGVYQAINQEFCRANCSHKRYVNREEDMGIAGIRTAKKSYNPIKYIERINISATHRLLGLQVV